MQTPQRKSTTSFFSDAPITFDRNALLCGGADDVSGATPPQGSRQSVDTTKFWYEPCALDVSRPNIEVQSTTHVVDLNAAHRTEHNGEAPSPTSLRQGPLDPAASACVVSGPSPSPLDTVTPRRRVKGSCAPANAHISRATAMWDISMSEQRVKKCRDVQTSHTACMIDSVSGCRFEDALSPDSLSVDRSGGRSLAAVSSAGGLTCVRSASRSLYHTNTARTALDDRFDLSSERRQLASAVAYNESVGRFSHNEGVSLCYASYEDSVAQALAAAYGSPFVRNGDEEEDTNQDLNDKKDEMVASHDLNGKAGGQSNDATGVRVGAYSSSTESPPATPPCRGLAPSHTSTSNSQSLPASHASSSDVSMECPINIDALLNVTPSDDKKHAPVFQGLSLTNKGRIDIEDTCGGGVGGEWVTQCSDSSMLSGRRAPQQQSAVTGTVSRAHHIDTAGMAVPVVGGSLSGRRVPSFMITQHQHSSDMVSLSATAASSLPSCATPFEGSNAVSSTAPPSSFLMCSSTPSPASLSTVNTRPSTGQVLPGNAVEVLVPTSRRQAPPLASMAATVATVTVGTNRSGAGARAGSMARGSDGGSEVTVDPVQEMRSPHTPRSTSSTFIAPFADPNLTAGPIVTAMVEFKMNRVAKCRCPLSISQRVRESVDVGSNLYLVVQYNKSESGHGYVDAGVCSGLLPSPFSEKDVNTPTLSAFVPPTNSAPNAALPQADHLLRPHLANVLRIATDADCRRINEVLPELEERAMKECHDLLNVLKLPIECVDVEFSFDGSCVRVYYRKISANGDSSEHFVQLQQELALRLKVKTVLFDDCDHPLEDHPQEDQFDTKLPPACAKGTHHLQSTMPTVVTMRASTIHSQASPSTTMGGNPLLSSNTLGAGCVLVQPTARRLPPSLVIPQAQDRTASAAMGTAHVHSVSNGVSSTTATSVTSQHHHDAANSRTSAFSAVCKNGASTGGLATGGRPSPTFPSALSVSSQTLVTVPCADDTCKTGCSNESSRPQRPDVTKGGAINVGLKNTKVVGAPSSFVVTASEPTGEGLREVSLSRPALGSFSTSTGAQTMAMLGGRRIPNNNNKLLTSAYGGHSSLIVGVNAHATPWAPTRDVSPSLSASTVMAGACVPRSGCSSTSPSPSPSPCFPPGSSSEQANGLTGPQAKASSHSQASQAPHQQPPSHSPPSFWSFTATPTGASKGTRAHHNSYSPQAASPIVTNNATPTSPFPLASAAMPIASSRRTVPVSTFITNVQATGDNITYYGTYATGGGGGGGGGAISAHNSRPTSSAIYHQAFPLSPPSFSGHQPSTPNVARVPSSLNAGELHQQQQANDGRLASYFNHHSSASAPNPHMHSHYAHGSRSANVTPVPEASSRAARTPSIVSHATPSELSVDEYDHVSPYATTQPAVIGTSRRRLH